ncbi:hypothetical protein Tco_0072600 [Tanacetum coccineum]
MSSFNQRGCYGCGGPLDGLLCRRCTCEWCGNNLRNGFCSICDSGAGNSFVYDPNSNSFNDPPNFFNHPPQPQLYSCELCGNDSHYSYDCQPRYSIDHQPQSIQEDLKELIKSHKDELLKSLGEMLREQVANLNTHTPEPSRRFNFIYDDNNDDEESTIPLIEIISQIPPSIVITPVLPTMEPEDSLNMGDEHLSTIPEKESDKVIKSSVEDLVPIPSESEDTSDNDNECDLPFCDNTMIFSNPFFDSNDDFTSIGHYNLYDVNPLFNEVFEDIESMDSYVSKLDEPALLVKPLFDTNEDECFDPGGDIDEIEACLTSDSIPPEINDADFDPEGDILLLEKIARIMKTLVLVVLSIVHSSFYPSHVYLWESDILDLID